MGHDIQQGKCKANYICNCWLLCKNYKTVLLLCIRSTGRNCTYQLVARLPRCHQALQRIIRIKLWVKLLEYKPYYYCKLLLQIPAKTYHVLLTLPQSRQWHRWTVMRVGDTYHQLLIRCLSCHLKHTTQLHSIAMHKVNPLTTTVAIWVQL